MTIRIDIRNEVFRLRDLVDEAVCKALAQVLDEIRPIVAKHDLDTDEGRAAASAEVSALVLEEINHLSGTTHMTDSVEGFVSAQLVRKLIPMAAEPAMAIMEVKWG